MKHAYTALLAMTLLSGWHVFANNEAASTAAAPDAEATPESPTVDLATLPGLPQEMQAQIARSIVQDKELNEFLFGALPLQDMTVSYDLPGVTAPMVFGDNLIASTQDGQITIWDMIFDQQGLQRLSKPQYFPGTWPYFSYDADILTTVVAQEENPNNTDFTIRSVNLATEPATFKVQNTFSLEGQDLLDSSHDGTKIVTNTRTTQAEEGQQAAPTIFVRSATDGTVLAQLELDGQPYNAEFNHNGTHILITTPEVPLVWEWQNEDAQLIPLPYHPGTIPAPDSDGNTFARFIGKSDTVLSTRAWTPWAQWSGHPLVKLWKTDGTEIDVQGIPATAKIDSIDFDEAGNLIVFGLGLGDERGKALIVNAQTGAIVQEISCTHTMPSITAAFTEDGKRVITIADKAVTMWGVKGRADKDHILASLEHDDTVLFADITPSGDHLISMTPTKVYVWDITDASGKLLSTVDAPQNTVFSNERSLLVAGDTTRLVESVLVALTYNESTGTSSTTVLNLEPIMRFAHELAGIDDVQQATLLSTLKKHRETSDELFDVTKEQWLSEAYRKLPPLVKKAIQNDIVVPRKR